MLKEKKNQKGVYIMYCTVYVHLLYTINTKFIQVHDNLFKYNYSIKHDCIGKLKNKSRSWWYSIWFLK